MALDENMKLCWDINKELLNNCVTVCKDGNVKIAIQLTDNEDKKLEKKGLAVCLGRAKGLVMTPDIKLVKTDSGGNANFGLIEISLRDDSKIKTCPFLSCLFGCYGCYFLRAKITLDGQLRTETIDADPIELHVICDERKPIKFQVGCCHEINSDKEIIGNDLIAGNDFPYFEVQLFAENDAVVLTVRKEQLYMELRYQSKEPAEQATKIFPAYQQHGKFEFHVNDPPVSAGLYRIQFHYKGKTNISSCWFKLNLACGVPVRLAPRAPHSKIFVSSNGSLAHRTIANSFELLFVDEYGNDATSDIDTENYKGSVEAKLQSKPNLPQNIVPQINGHTYWKEFPLTAGRAIIGNLVLDEETAGVVGFEYVVTFSPKLRPSEVALERYEIAFVFLKEAEKQEHFTQLERKRTQALERVEETKKCIRAIKNKTKSLEAMYTWANISEAESLKKLNQHWEKGNLSFSSPEELVVRMNAKQTEIKNLEDVDKNRPFSKCPLSKPPKETGILGKVGHLALLENPNERRIVSWKMQENLNVIVTLESRKAVELNRRYDKRQKFLALDTIHEADAFQWNEPLPHEKTNMGRCNFRGKGNPVYARSLLCFTRNVSFCHVLFKSLLGNVLVMNSIEDALEYRNSVVGASSCPAILTRDGKTLTSDGTNRAPKLLTDLTSYFGLAANPIISKLYAEIDLLELLKIAMSNRIGVKDRLNKHEATTKRELEMFEKNLKAYREVAENCVRQVVDELNVLLERDNASAAATAKRLSPCSEEQSLDSSKRQKI